MGGCEVIFNRGVCRVYGEEIIGVFQLEVEEVYSGEGREVLVQQWGQQELGFQTVYLFVGLQIGGLVGQVGYWGIGLLGGYMKLGFGGVGLVLGFWGYGYIGCIGMFVMGIFWFRWGIRSSIQSFIFTGSFFFLFRKYSRYFWAWVFGRVQVGYLLFLFLDFV